MKKMLVKEYKSLYIISRDLIYSVVTRGGVKCS